ncbi:MAG: ribonuclease E/G, partial [Alphaproteobacteria bacterium]|nr:ribonuclease E/G [Alphaproteobacteria bacterium]
MTTRMLVDATHAEETRIVAVKGTRLVDFDFESANKKQLKGNIYLAKVTRVEPSLQAAFVDYGGNRHGFLAFNEIHPDYYQIPIADREALLREEAEQAAEQAAEEEREAEANGAAEDRADDGEDDADLDREAADNGNGQDSGDALDEVPRPRGRTRRNYKIQEVIKRRQILLVQVVKEERGNKGAALTTYLSLAGRYCVLMPNTARGGGISRKIANQTARRKLKKIVVDLEVPEGMGVIVRTAGMARTKSEIKRDFEYLLRLWDSVRDLTLESSAPTVVYEEADLIKRAIRDMYAKEIDEILV